MGEVVRTCGHQARWEVALSVFEGDFVRQRRKGTEDPDDTVRNAVIWSFEAAQAAVEGSRRRQVATCSDGSFKVQQSCQSSRAAALRLRRQSSSSSGGSSKLPDCETTPGRP